VPDVAPTDSIAQLALETLARKGRLAPDAARLHAAPLVRGGEACGVHFAVRGPRDVLLTAIWDAATGVLWCYDSRGERFDAVVAPSGDKMVDRPTTD